MTILSLIGDYTELTALIVGCFHSFCDICKILTSRKLQVTCIKMYIWCSFVNHRTMSAAVTNLVTHAVVTTVIMMSNRGH